MELPDLSTLSEWVLQYGSISLFILLALGIIALPVPEETLMMVTGLLISRGELPFLETVIAALLGSMTGITTSYLIGRSAGTFFLTKYGKWIGITDERMQKAHNWFERFGKWTLLIGYFIPGVRHFTGLIAGATALEFSQFALFAYTGAVLWVSLFLAVGYFFGNIAFTLYEKIEFTFDETIILISALITLAAILFGIYKWIKLSRKNNI